MIKIPVLLGSVALIAAGCASDPMGGTSSSSAAASTQGAGSGSMSSEDPSSSLAQADRQFITEAAQAGLAEVKMGQLAQERAQNEATKTFGQMLVNDHQKANQELMSIAARKGAVVPTDVGAKEAETLGKLSVAQGQEFDRMAAQENVKAHEKVVQRFQAAQNTVQDPELKAFIEKTLPTLQMHLQHAQQLQSQTSAVGGSDALESQAPESGELMDSPDAGTSSGSTSPQDAPDLAPGSPPMDDDMHDQQ